MKPKTQKTPILVSQKRKRAAFRLRTTSRILAGSISGSSLFLATSAFAEPVIVEYSNGNLPVPLNNDLLQTNLLSATQIAGPTIGNEGSPNLAKLYDGVFSTSGSQSITPNNGGVVVEFTFDTTGNTLGYDISSIAGYGGWGDGGRDRQDYSLSYSTVDDETTFIFIDSVAFDPLNIDGGNSAVSATFSPLALTGVKHLRVSYGVQENSYVGYGELDVIGFATRDIASTWVGGTDSNWGTDDNWDPFGVPGAGLLLFGSTGANPIADLGAAGRTVTALAFDPAVGTTIASATQILTFDNGATAVPVTTFGTHAISAPVALASDASFAVNGQLTVGAISENSAGKTLTKLDGGTLILGGQGTYTGGTTIGGGSLTIGIINALPTSGAVSLANTAGAVLNLNGNNQTIGSLSGGGLSGGGVTLGANAVLTVGNATSTAYSGVISGTGTAGLTKQGSGTLTLSAAQTYTGPTLVSGGTLQLPAVAAYRYYRFQVDSIVDNSGGGTQQSEIAFYSSGTNNNDGVRVLPVLGIGDGGSYLDGGIPALFDNDLNTKSFYGGIPRFVTFDFGTAQAFTGYNWATANDSTPQRNPNNFTLSGSNDNSLFTTLDIQTNAGGTTNTTFTWAPGWAIPSSGSSNVLPVGTTVTLAPGATLDLNGGSQQVASLTGSGTLTRSSTGSTVSVFTVGDASSTTFSGTISDQGASGSLQLVKVGTGTLTLLGANTHAGGTTVSAGTLAVNGTSIPDSGKLVISGGTVAPTGTEVVNTLFFGAAQQAAGTYGATGSGAGTIDNVRFSGTGIVSVTVGAADPYATFVSVIANPADRDPTDDPDADGIDNGSEFVIGGNPATMDDSALAPTITVDATYLNFTFRRTDTSAYLNPGVEYDTDLVGTWTPAVNGVSGVIVVETNDGFGAGVDRVEVRIPQSLAVSGRVFARLQVPVTP